MSRHLRPIDWSDIDEPLEILLRTTEEAVMRREVCWDDLSAEAQDRFTATAQRQMEAARQRDFDDARIEAAS